MGRDSASAREPAARGGLVLATPDKFSFRRTVLSHGWCSLPPFHFDRARFALERIVRLPAGRTIAVTIEEDPEARAALRLTWRCRDLASRERAALTAQVRHMLRLDEDFGEFYGAAARTPGYSWIAGCGAGRLLRSPTVFEDLVKLLCTTNCTWALTEVMVRNLVEKLGAPAEGVSAPSSRLRTTTGGPGIDWLAPGADVGRPALPRAFPTPEAMAAKNVRFFEKEIRAGYRAAALAKLAREVASGRLDVEAWLSSDLPTGELKKRILAVRGAGPYTAENLMKLLGRYEGLGLDSWSRAKFSRLHPRVGSRGGSAAARASRNRRRAARAREHRAAGAAGSSKRGGVRRPPPPDPEIERYYARFGRWRGLAFWCDLTRDWLEDGPAKDAGEGGEAESAER